MSHCDSAAEIAESSQETLDGFGFVMPTEVIGAQVFVGDTVAQHEVGGGQHRGGDGEDGFLGTPSGFDPEELRLQTAIFGAHRRPSGRNEGGFEPRSAFAYARLAPLERP